MWVPPIVIEAFAELFSKSDRYPLSGAAILFLHQHRQNEVEIILIVAVNRGLDYHAGLGRVHLANDTLGTASA